MKNVHGKTIKFVSNQTIKKKVGEHNSGRQVLETKTLKVVGPPVTKVGKLIDSVNIGNIYKLLIFRFFCSPVYRETTKG